MCFKIGNETSWESNSFRLLGMKTDPYLKFEIHLPELICKNADRKIKALSSLGKYLSFQKKRADL